MKLKQDLLIKFDQCSTEKANTDTKNSIKVS